jgi:hypothetical protein
LPRLFDFGRVWRIVSHDQTGAFAMKITTAVAALAVLAFAGSAHAYMFSPKHKKFTLSGNVLLSNNTNCMLAMSGSTHGERAVITDAAFSGPGCSEIVPAQLPWKVEMSDGGQPIIEKLFFKVGNSQYRVHKQAVTVDGSGNWTFIPSGRLEMSGTIPSTPPIIIKP